jgi:hypothetical protein
LAYLSSVENRMKITAVERNRFNWIGAACTVDLFRTYAVGVSVNVGLVR